MSYEKDNIRKVYTQYGTRFSGGEVGQESSIDSVRRFTVGLNDVSLGESPYVAPVVVPKGAKLRNATLFVYTPFGAGSGGTGSEGTGGNTGDVGGTTPGTDEEPGEIPKTFAARASGATSVVVGNDTDGISLSGELGAEGVYSVTSAATGTWAADATGLTEDQVIEIKGEGLSSPVDGNATLVLEFEYK